MESPLCAVDQERADPCTTGSAKRTPAARRAPGGRQIEPGCACTVLSASRQWLRFELVGTAATAPGRAGGRVGVLGMRLAIAGAALVGELGQMLLHSADRRHVVAVRRASHIVSLGAMSELGELNVDAVAAHLGFGECEVGRSLAVAAHPLNRMRS